MPATAAVAATFVQPGTYVLTAFVTKAMMINGRLLHILLVVASLQCSAQSILSAAGNNQSSLTIKQSYTVGESFVADQHFLSHGHAAGFQQPEIPQINVRLFIQGFYIGSGVMQAVADPSNAPSLTDTIRITFITNDPALSPFYSTPALLATDGWASIFLPTLLFNHSYYLKINHRNSIETWSKSPILIKTVNRFDFTGL
jgi:hypothetical protein